MTKILTSLAAPVAILIVGLPIAAAAQPPQTPKPGPEHERLGYFVGKWTSEGEMKPGPMGPGGKMTSTETCEWFDGRAAVICRSEGTGPTGATKGLGILSYSPEEKVYTYYGVENNPGMAMTSVPRGTVQGDTWTYTDEALMGGSKVKTRVTIKEVSPTSQTFRMEVEQDGKWVPVMESKGTKIN